MWVFCGVLLCWGWIIFGIGWVVIVGELEDGLGLDWVKVWGGVLEIVIVGEIFVVCVELGLIVEVDIVVCVEFVFLCGCFLFDVCVFKELFFWVVFMGSDCIGDFWRDGFLCIFCI